MFDLVLLLMINVGPVPVCAWVAARATADARASHPIPFGHAWLALLVTWCTAQITVVLLLGALRVLNLPALMVAEVCLFVLGLWCWRLERRREMAVDVRGTFYPVTMPSSAHAGALFTLTVVGLCLLWHVLLKPTANYDSLAYHLPSVVQWYQDGYFRMMPELRQAAFYSYNWELLGLLNSFPLREDLFIAAPNLISWTLFGLAVFCGARWYGASPTQSLVAATLVLTLPTVLTRVDATQPDLALAAFFLAGLYFAEVALRTGSGWAIGLLLICLGMLPGLKMSGLGYVPLLLSRILLPRLFAGWRTALVNPQIAPRWLCMVLILSAFLGGFWYVRNLIYNGNPLGFMQVELFGREVLSGFIDREDVSKTTLLSIFDPRSRQDWTTLWQVAREFLSFSFLALVLMSLVALVGARSMQPVRVWTMFLLLGSTLVLYWSSPYSGDNGRSGHQFTTWMSVNLRYAFPFMGMLGIVAAQGFRALRLRGLWLLPIAVFTAVFGVMWVMQIEGPVQRLSVGSALVLSLLALRWRDLPEWTARAPARVATVSVFLIALGIVSLEARGRREFHRERNLGTIWTWLEQNVSEDEVIGYARTYRRYTLYGKRMSRRAVPVPPRSYDMDEWIEDLRRQNIDYVAVGMADAVEISKTEADVREWVQRDDGPFEQVFAAQSTTLDLALFRLVDH